MLKNKKGQGLSITTIIVAAIAVVVLVVLIAIFTGQMGNWIAKLTGGGDPEMAKDKLSSNCLPTSNLYETISRAKDDLAKLKSVPSESQDKTKIAAAETTLNTAIGDKNKKLYACKTKNEAACIQDSTNCQWLT